MSGAMEQRVDGLRAGSYLSDTSRLLREMTSSAGYEDGNVWTENRTHETRGWVVQRNQIWKSTQSQLVQHGCEFDFTKKVHRENKITLPERSLSGDWNFMVPEWCCGSDFTYIETQCPVINCIPHSISQEIICLLIKEIYHIIFKS